MPARRPRLATRRDGVPAVPESLSAVLATHPAIVPSHYQRRVSHPPVSGFSYRFGVITLASDTLLCRSPTGGLPARDDGGKTPASELLEQLTKLRTWSAQLYRSLNGRPRILVRRINPKEEFDVVLLGGSTCTHIDLADVALLSQAAPQVPVRRNCATPHAPGVFVKSMSHWRTGLQ